MYTNIYNIKLNSGFWGMWKKDYVGEGMMYTL